MGRCKPSDSRLGYLQHIKGTKIKGSLSHETRRFNFRQYGRFVCSYGKRLKMLHHGNVRTEACLVLYQNGS